MTDQRNIVAPENLLGHQVREESLRITLDYRGILPDSIVVSATDNKLIITGTDGEQHSRQVLQLPKEVQPGTITHTIKNGILDITAEAKHVKQLNN